MGVDQSITIRGYTAFSGKFPYSCLLVDKNMPAGAVTITQWCNKNFGYDAWARGYAYTDDRWGSPTVFWGVWYGFVKQEDCVQFKLRWV